ncbi:GreA/GreB family elongation factor [Paenibacillus nasutitermitis]|uniref:Transcription elongation factor GreA/GreB C-terminal domain-containing protein n=1 Tax=Paenibacillus nasutitermitis TaxID=1652958 RepID=A0A917E3M0_9BACL|nr:GreA/GreB family elongation factor [Paenibacillus nasutitermitis]GGD97962.1 hypothetical protein GCM10010911_65950 [Paenibacillus nasutitermitis]
MSHSLLHQDVKLQLVSQLVYFDEEKTRFLDHYFPDHGRERNKVEQVLFVYSSVLEKIVNDFNETTLHSSVIIGSRVKLRYLDDDYEESYTIVFPQQTDAGQNRISFLSPIGMQLLMTKKGETYGLIVPSGEIKVKIEEVAYDNCGQI